MAVAALATVAAAFIGIARGTHAAGGSDSHCYLSQADAFAAGRTFLAEPLAAIAAWPSARATLSPAGFLPSETRPGGERANLSTGPVADDGPPGSNRHRG